MAALETGFFDDQIEGHLKESFYVNDTIWKEIIKFVKRESSLEQTYAEFKILAQSPKSSPDYIVQTMGQLHRLFQLVLQNSLLLCYPKLLKH